MTVNWPLYETLLGNGNTANRREVAINESVSAFENGMVDDPAYQGDAMVNGVHTPIVASRKTTISCSIKAKPLTDIHIGDMVRCFGENWIVVGLWVDKVGLINGEMWLCNYLLRFQNNSSVINENYCVVDDGTYSKNTSNADARAMANTYQIYITIDEQTRRMYVDKRLSLGRIYSSRGEEILEVYKIIGMDMKSKNYGNGSHLMVLTLQRDVYDERTDDLSENICNIYHNSADESEPQTSGSCVIMGRDSIRIGTTRKYNVEFTNLNGETISEVTPAWVVSAPSGIVHSASGAICSISVPLNEQYVGETITITVSDENSAFGYYEKKVQVTTVG